MIWEWFEVYELRVIILDGFIRVCLMKPLVFMLGNCCMLEVEFNLGVVRVLSPLN